MANATDGWEAIKTRIAELTHRQLVVVGKALNGGALGFDPQKLKKEEVAAKVRQFAYAKLKKEEVAAKVRQFAYAASTKKDGWSPHEADAKSACYALVLAAIDAEVRNMGGDLLEGAQEASGEAQDADAGVDAEALEALRKLLTPKAPTIDMAKIRAMLEQATAHIPTLVATEVARQSAVYRVEVKRPDMPVIEADAEPRHEVFGEVLAAVSAGLNVLLVGPAGAGKTHLGKQLAKALGVRFGFSGAVGSEYKLLGYTDPNGRIVRTVYREFFENGGLFLKDEIDGSSPNALLSINAALANGTQDFPDAVIPMHPDFRVIASANTYGHGADRQYVGRNQLDAASLDRFYVIPMGYDERLERTLFGDCEWVGFVHKVRAAVSRVTVRHVVSMRAIEQGLKALAAGIDRPSVERAVIWKHLTAADIAKVRAAMA